MNNQEFPVASLTDDSLEKVKHMENELRQETNEDIILIAYKNGKIQQNINTST
ncbi:hypothetical protein [Rossellomorea aquimaris]|uniref:hypothetical protein n=1 Tax=Rossellomorea aquimaris TaxID=189382 RepID=UPI000A6098F8|nr:hypothetical protein [Rossellomorea aquimaris]